MEFSEVIRRRRMVRRFADRPLGSETVDRILASALRAPSAGFAQGWAFLALTEPEDLDRFWPFVPNQVRHTPDLRNAPLVVIPLAHKAAYLERYAEPDKRWEDRAESRWPAPYWHIDTGMAALMMLLTAVDEGLGAFFFWIMPPVSELEVDGAVQVHLAALRAEFGIPDDFTPIGAIAVGHRATDLEPQDPRLSHRRRSMADVVHRGGWGRH
ncbi:nitroreductase family protein [Catellatospora sp. KI3]|uniref:nitroreductase family protein n=1 Tax=Catellatospora sp. KI3 TaxID=3041620 RepID=UPI00248244E3|nr:nitroreductase family protein [Catellatospora sp. KI3]MDI1461845.1 nitroreductase family protein [Catellatospora sp. KI3]